MAGYWMRRLNHQAGPCHFPFSPGEEAKTFPPQQLKLINFPHLPVLLSRFAFLLCIERPAYRHKNNAESTPGEDFNCGTRATRQLHRISPTNEQKTKTLRSFPLHISHPAHQPRVVGLCKMGFARRHPVKRSGIEFSDGSLNDYYTPAVRKTENFCLANVWVWCGASTLPVPNDALARALHSRALATECESKGHWQRAASLLDVFGAGESFPHFSGCFSTFNVCCCYAMA